MYPVPMGEVPRMRLHALIAVYNAHETIRNCLDSVSKIVDDIIICEGRWIGVEGKSIVSNDGTHDDISNWVIETPYNGSFTWFKAGDTVHQYQARNILLNQVPEGDWFIIIDSDETIISFSENLKEFLETSKEIAYKCNQKDKTQTNAKPFVHPRLLKKIRGMHYGTNHRYLLDVNNEIIPLGNSPTFQKICFLHNGQNKSMRETMNKYKSWLRDWEIQHQ